MSERPRSIFVGMTDYTGVPLDAILPHLRKWRDNTTAAAEELVALRDKVEANQDRLDGPREILSYIDFFIDLFGRFAGDFERLLTEIPRGVTESHVQIVEQIYESASHEERHCIGFKNEHIERSLKDEDLRWLVDNIYSQSRSMLIDYLDLSNLVPRLRTYVGTSVETLAEQDRRFAMMAIEEAGKAFARIKDLAPRWALSL